jgi:hypothetical protein
LEFGNVFAILILHGRNPVLSIGWFWDLQSSPQRYLLPEGLMQDEAPKLYLSWFITIR